MKTRMGLLASSWAVMTVCACACTDLGRMQNGLAATVVIDLEPGQKLEDVEFGERESPWFLTRAMRAGEDAEEHVFGELSSQGLIGRRKFVVREHR